MSKNRQVVLTEGPILKALIALALPIMATSFLNTFYSITDMAWIGMLGSRAVAGVGVGGVAVAGIVCSGENGRTGECSPGAGTWKA